MQLRQRNDENDFLSDYNTQINKLAMNQKFGAILLIWAATIDTSRILAAADFFVQIKTVLIFAAILAFFGKLPGFFDKPGETVKTLFREIEAVDKDEMATMFTLSAVMLIPTVFLWCLFNTCAGPGNIAGAVLPFIDCAFADCAVIITFVGVWEKIVNPRNENKDGKDSERKEEVVNEGKKVN